VNSLSDGALPQAQGPGPSAEAYNASQNPYSVNLGRKGRRRKSMEGKDEKGKERKVTVQLYLNYPR